MVRMMPAKKQRNRFCNQELSGADCACCGHMSEKTQAPVVKKQNENAWNESKPPTSNRKKGSSSEHPPAGCVCYLFADNVHRPQIIGRQQVHGLALRRRAGGAAGCLAGRCGLALQSRRKRFPPPNPADTHAHPRKMTHDDISNEKR